MKIKQFRQMFGVLGMLLVMEGFFMLMCVFVALYYRESIQPILFSGIISILAGFLLILLRTPKSKESIDKRVAILTVSLSWLIISSLGALPYLFSDVLSNFTNAFFESMSGFTTTGASVIEQVESAPKSIIFWRALTQWIGGMGIIVLVVAIIPFLGINSMSLYSAEVPGPSKDKLHPRILTSSRRLWNTYCVVTLLFFVLLLLGGLSPFESLVHTFSAVSTGGFSIKNDSVAGYSSYVQCVIALAMLVSAFNYSLNYYLVKGKFKKVFQSEELKVFLLMFMVAGTFMSVELALTTHFDVFDAIKHGFFQVSSIATTTGFVSSDYNTWSSPILFIFLILMLCGGMAGSTSGGLKTIRLMIIFKNCRQVLRNIVHSRALLPIRVDGKAIPENILHNTLAFFLIYILVFVFASLAMMFLQIDVHESMASIAACISSYGPGYGESGGFGNYNHFPAIGKWILSIVMFLGRLEFVTVLIILFPPFWKN